MRRALTFAMVVGLLLGEGAALAEDIVPLVPKMDPPAVAERVALFHDALAEGLKAGGAAVMPAATVRAKLKLPLESAGCDEGPCLQTNAALLGSVRLATARVSSVGKNYTVEVRLFRGRVPIAKASARCDICNNAEAVQTLQRLATDLGGKAEEPPAAPPPRAPLPAPPRVTPSVSPGPQPPAPPPRPPAPLQPPPLHQPQPQAAARPLLDQPPGPTVAKPRIPLWTAIVAAGVGVVGVAVGAPLVAIDGNGTNCRGGEARPDKRNCQDLYATAAGGWTLTAIGATGLIAAAVLFPLHFIPQRKAERPRATTVDRFSIAPLQAGGLLLGASGRF